jgi:hypothetical protein
MKKSLRGTGISAVTLIALTSACLMALSVCSAHAQARGEASQTATRAVPTSTSSGEPLSPTHLYPATEIAALYQRPSTGLELLRNLRLAKDLNLLLQPAFFEDSNLLRFFGGTSVTWHRPVASGSGKYQDATVVFRNTPFSGMVVDLRRGELLVGLQKQPQKRWDHPAHTQKSGLVTMKFDPIPGLTVEAVRHEFGLAPIEVGVESIPSTQRPGASTGSVSNPSGMPLLGDAEATDSYLRYVSRLDLATRLASHVEKWEAIFGIGASQMIVAAKMFESEM